MKSEATSTNRWSLSTSGATRVSSVGSCRLRFACSFLLLAVLLIAGSPAQAEIKAGDILVVDAIGGTNGGGALFLVNPTTGQRTVLSDFGNPVQGNLGNGDLTGVAVGRTGQIFVSALISGDPAFEGGAIFEVDPDTGNRILRSNFSQGDIRGFLAYGLAVNARGKVIANLDRSEPPTFEPHSALIRVDPETDARALITDLTNPDQGDTVAGFISDLTLERSGKILIGTDEGSFEEPDAKIFRVRPVTGKRKLLSDFSNPAQGTDVGDLNFSTGLAVEASGRILVVSGFSVVAPRSLLFRIHPKTGQRTVLSDFDDSAQGPLGVYLHGVAVEESGKIVVGAGDAATGASAATLLFRVNPKTGQRALLSDSNNPDQGPPFQGIVYIIVRTDSHGDRHWFSDGEGDGDGQWLGDGDGQD